MSVRGLALGGLTADVWWTLGPAIPLVVTGSAEMALLKLERHATVEMVPVTNKRLGAATL
jgi:hypothetical protein